jgi:pyocin large subunit-like protein
MGQWHAPIEPAVTTSRLAAEGGTSGALDLSTEESWGDLAKFEDHFLRHGPDFNSGSADEYAQQASQFLQQIDQEGLEIKVGPNGTIRIYDPSTNTFGSFNPDGTTKTFFRPTSGPAYWANQPGVSPWGGP